MKHLKFLPFLLLFVSFLSAQNFEGKITYSLNCKSKNPKKTDAELNLKYGTLNEFYIKDGNYKSIENNQNYEWNLYISKQNKLYRKYPKDKVVGIRDCATTYEYPSKIRLTQDSVLILGYTCREMIITYKCVTYKFYYSTAISMDPVFFENNNFEAWYEFLSRSGALPLKVIQEKDDYIMTKEAIKVEKTKLNNSVFILAKGTKTKPVSVVLDCYK